MATSAMALINGVGRMTPITASMPNIYDQQISIVASGSPPSTVTGPISATTPLTLPASGSYTVVTAVTSLEIYLNGNRLEYGIDWQTSGAGPNFTAFSMISLSLVVGDVLDLRTERNT